MTKQEKIKEAYGEYYLETAVDEDGWTNTITQEFLNNIPCESKEMHVTFGNPEHWYRPLPLKGIENNNGWIKIESNDYLPTDEDIIEFWVIDDGEVIASKFMHESKRWYSDVELNLQLFPTHYQPIEKPKPPIY